MEKIKHFIMGVGSVVNLNGPNFDSKMFLAAGADVNTRSKTVWTRTGCRLAKAVKQFFADEFPCVSS